MCDLPDQSSTSARFVLSPCLETLTNTEQLLTLILQYNFTHFCNVSQSKTSRKAPSLQQKCGSDYLSCMLNDLQGKPWEAE